MVSGSQTSNLKEKNGGTSRSYSRHLSRVARVVAVILMAGGAATLWGSMTRWLPAAPWMPISLYTSYSASIAFILAGGSLLFWTQRPRTHYSRPVGRLLGLGVLLIAQAGVAMFVHQLWLSGGQLPNTRFADYPFRMPLLTSFALTLMGLALMFLDRLIRRRHRPSEYLALAGGILGFVATLRYIYGLPEGLPAEYESVTSFSSAVLILLLCLGLVTSRPTGTLGTLLSNPGIAGTLTRRIFLLLILLPAPLGLLRQVGLRYEWYDHLTGMALSSVGYVALFGAAILAFGRKLFLVERNHRNAERLLLAREFDARVAFNYAPVGIGQISTRARWVRINRHLSDIFGYEHMEFLALPVHRLVPPEDQEEWAGNLKQVLRGEIGHYSSESRFVHKDGSVIWCKLTVNMPDAPRDYGLGRRYAIVVMEDVTERKNAQFEIVRQKAAAEAANQAKDRFISVISHELRTPLTPVLATLSAYPVEELNEEQAKVLRMMRRNIEHEVCLIDDLLELTRLEHGKLRLTKAPVDLHALLQELHDSLQDTFHQKGLYSRLILRAERHNVEGDRARLRQVFLNLLDNAKKFTPEGGEIIISTMNRDGTIVTSVKDTGGGISADALERIFEAFEQGERRSRQHGGLGLGLAISRGLIEAHHGQIAVESEGEDRGSTFSVQLETISEHEKLPADAPRSNERLTAFILLVEDHADTRTTLQRLLERRGHRVVSAGTMREAIALAAEVKPEVLVSDIGLPDGDGLLLRREIERTCGLELPSIALSGFAGTDDLNASAQAGYLRHLVKPIEIHELEAAIAEVQSSRLQTGEK